MLPFFFSYTCACLCCLDVCSIGGCICSADAEASVTLSTVSGLKSLAVTNFSSCSAILGNKFWTVNLTAQFAFSNAQVIGGASSARARAQSAQNNQRSRIFCASCARECARSSCAGDRRRIGNLPGVRDQAHRKRISQHGGNHVGWVDLCIGRGDSESG